MSGVFAETKDGVLEVNAKAVVLAGGGWAANLDMLAEYGGYDMDITKTSCAPGSVGDTLKMAAAIGGREEAKARGYMFGNLIDGISSYSLPQYYPAIWVNENGERFANEDCGEPCHDYTGTAVGAQDRVYIVLNDAMVDEAEAQGNKDLRKEIEAAAGGASKAVFKGADAADLAKQAGWTGDFAETLATYCDETYAMVKDVAEHVEKANLLYITGDAGLNVIAQGSYHAEIIDLLSNNLAVVDSPSSKGTGNEVDMEQLMLWNPDVILFAPDSVYASVGDDPLWQSLTAIQNGSYYEAPMGPYNWMGFPPSVQRYLGMLWMAKAPLPRRGGLRPPGRGDRILRPLLPLRAHWRAVRGPDGQLDREAVNSHVPAPKGAGRLHRAVDYAYNREKGGSA